MGWFFGEASCAATALPILSKLNAGLSQPWRTIEVDPPLTLRRVCITNSQKYRTEWRSDQFGDAGFYLETRKAFKSIEIELDNHLEPWHFACVLALICPECSLEAFQANDAKLLLVSSIEGNK